MCLTLPAQVLSISQNNSILVDFDGQNRLVNVAFNEGLMKGDWVLVNANLAIAKISRQEAEEITDYFTHYKPRV
jgi:hydrogenase assembly chaperone HypC/HupF